MINYKNIYAGAAVLNEFKDKLKTLCGEYEAKLAAVCPENISDELWNEESQTLCPINIHISGRNGRITKDEITENSFVYIHSSGICNVDYYEKEVNGISVVCSIERDVPAMISLPDEVKFPF